MKTASGNSYITTANLPYGEVQKLVDIKTLQIVAGIL